MASPIPRAAPVTIATFPVNKGIIMFLVEGSTPQRMIRSQKYLKIIKCDMSFLALKHFL
jgi:hypothetical protein